MWVVLDLNGDVVAKFSADRAGWLKAVKWATDQGGEMDVVFLAHAK